MNSYWNLIQSLYSADIINISAKIKTNIVQKVISGLYSNARSIAFLNYNPIIEELAKLNYRILLVEDQKELVQNSSIEFFDLHNCSRKFDIVIGLDEYLTYFATEQDQKNQLAAIKNICQGYFITSLVDYKNAAPYRKTPTEIVENRNNNILIENHVSNIVDKQAWTTYYYFIQNQTDFNVTGPYQRRTLYFKQLAKYVSDLNSSHYAVQKDELYKGFAKRYWEHIITVGF